MSAIAANVLSSMSGMTPRELTQQAQSIVKNAPAGSLDALSSLDAALVDAASGASSSALDSFKSMTQTRTEETHVVESANRAYKRTIEAPGYKKGPYAASMPTQSAIGMAGQAGSDRIREHPLMTALASDKGPQLDADAKRDQRQLQFEKLKNEMNKITQITNMLTNVLKAMNDQAMSAIRNIKA